MSNDALRALGKLHDLLKQASFVNDGGLRMTFAEFAEDYLATLRAALTPPADGTLAERCAAAEARVKELEAGLAPFVREHADFFGQPDENYYKMRVEIGALKRAAELLNASK